LKLSPETLQAHLATQLLPVYVVSGEEPLLATEALDALRARAVAAGYTEREVFFLERNSASWDELRQSGKSMSLFGSRRILELRLPTGKPGNGAALLLELIAAAGPDELLLILTGALDRDAQKAEWLQAANARGAVLDIRAVDRSRLPSWLRGRLRAVGLEADDDAIALIVERCEGNLLAAQQEIDKLLLLRGKGATITAADAAASSAQSARFDVFQLGAAVQSRNAARALTVIAGLRADGDEQLLALWVLARELRAMQSADLNSGARRWRLPYARLAARAVRVDRMIKGGATGNYWDEMGLLATELCGLRILPMEAVPMEA
jgi:DNA polymerase-3 subunit delta